MSGFPPVAELVPHEAPMLAIEELLERERGRARVSMTVRDDQLFVRDGRIDTICTLEYMAQAVAACLGHEAISEGGAVRVGMVVACRSMTIHRPQLEVGEQLFFEVERVQGTPDMSQFDGRTRDAQGALVAEIAMTLVHTERPPEASGGKAFAAGAVRFGGFSAPRAGGGS